jgi:hypothetical protein
MDPAELVDYGSWSHAMTHFARYDEVGNIVATGTIPDHLVKNQVGNVIVGQFNRETQYVANGVVCGYTVAELSDRANMPAGWIWKMPDRKAIDPRTNERRAADALDNVMDLRRQAYPDLAAFADAMYWSARGDQSKLADYYSACDAVKSTYPKP